MLKRPSQASPPRRAPELANQAIAESITRLSSDAVRQPVERCRGASLLGLPHVLPR